MKIYYQKDDRVRIFSNTLRLDSLLEDYFKEEKGRYKVIDDIKGTTGTVVGVVEGMGHKEVLYSPDHGTHSWKLPVSVFDLPTPLQTALSSSKI